jgi:diaminopimelate decarboxylase
LQAGQRGKAIEATLVHIDLLNLAGIHSHIGSQIFINDGFEVAATRLIELLSKVSRTL